MLEGIRDLQSKSRIFLGIGVGGGSGGEGGRRRRRGGWKDRGRRYQKLRWDGGQGEVEEGEEEGKGEEGGEGKGGRIGQVQEALQDLWRRLRIKEKGGREEQGEG